MEFPATLYKHGSAFLWDGEMFDYLIVHDQDEADAGLKAGWSIGKPKPKVVPKPKADT